MAGPWGGRRAPCPRAPCTPPLCSIMMASAVEHCTLPWSTAQPFIGAGVVLGTLFRGMGSSLFICTLYQSQLIPLFPDHNYNFHSILTRRAESLTIGHCERFLFYFE
eukprot:EG_transcript_28066